MHAKGVVCGDCHDVHSGKLKAEGPLVCAQCHDQQRFTATAHTGHQPGKGAPDCITCHMPARTYMVVDRRHDHSFRIPRPDLTASLGTPNTCNACHADKTAQWAADAVAAWHGPDRKGFQTYARTFHDARRGDPAARAALIALANDPEAAGIVRATAQGELGRLPAIATESAIRLGLKDADPVVRVAALRNIAPQPAEIRLRWAGDLLADPVRGVRIEAARALADIRPEGLPVPLRGWIENAFAEFEATQRLNDDQPEARSSLALFLSRRGRLAEAEAELRAGIRLDPTAVEIAVNLADLLRHAGREAEAEQILRQAIAVAPDEAYPRHALGLALVRQRRYPEALESLAQASRLAPGDARLAYVHGVALQSLGQQEKGRQVLREALQANPFDVAILSALLADAQSRRDMGDAAALAARLSPLRPDDAELARYAARLARP
jgi:predicted CXXCH cytochrome family protein